MTILRSYHIPLYYASTIFLSAAIPLSVVSEDKQGLILLDSLYSAYVVKENIERIEFDTFLNQMVKEGLLYYPKPGVLRRTTV